MKKLILILALAFGLQASAQVSVNVNIGPPPAWAPVGAEQVGFYYLPDIYSYYDVRTTEFIYPVSGRWVRSRSLPPAYRNYDLYHGRTIVLRDYHGNAPYTYYKTHKVKYGKPAKVKYVGNPGRGNSGKAKGHGNGKGHGKKH